MWIFIPIVIVLILLVVGFLAVFGGASWSWLGKKQRHNDEVKDAPAAEQLRYRIPPGQDGAVVVAALRKEGFDAVADQGRGGHQEVLVACPQGRERVRAQVRSVIQDETRVNMSFGDETEVPEVRFADEQGV